MILPTGPLVDPKTGEPTSAGKVFLQRLANAQGGPAYEIALVRISDTVVRIRMVGADGETRWSPDITLS